MKYAMKDGKVCMFSEDPNEILEALEQQKRLEAIIKTKVELAVHDLAGRIYNNYVIIPKQGNDFDPEIVRQSEANIDKMVAAVLNIKSTNK